MGCKEGIILAADGQTTHLHSLSSDVYTRSETRKIQEFGKNKLWAASGNEVSIIEFEKRIDALSDEVKETSLTDLDSELSRSLKDIAVGIRDRDPKSLESCIVVDPEGIWYWERNADEPKTWHRSLFVERSKFLRAGNPAAVLAAQVITNRYLDRRYKPEQGAEYYGRQYTLEQGAVAMYGAMTEAINLLAVWVGDPIDIRAIRNNGVIVPFDQDKLEECYSDFTKEDCRLFEEVVRRHFKK
jgi:hypothetical protein